MPQGFYLKTAVGSVWSKITNFYVKTSTAGWSQVQDAWIKTSTGAWTKFYSALMAPSQDVEIAGTYGGYNNETLLLRGKNYVWSPTPQSLKYYFREVNSDGTTYIGSGGSSGATASNTISYYPSSTTYLTIAPDGGNFKLGGATKYFFEVRATGASGTIYSSLSADTGTSFAPVIYSPLAPTLTLKSSTSTSATITITAAADTTGTWGFSSWGATYRYIVYTYDSVGGTIYSGGGRGGIPATTSTQDITLTGLTAGRTYYVYVLPTTGTAGSRPFAYNASTQTSGYSGYPGVEASLVVALAAPPTISVSPTLTLQSGAANTVNSVYRLDSGTWTGNPTEYRYRIEKNDQAGTVLAYYPSSTTWTTQTYYDHTFTATTGTNTVSGVVIARNTAGESLSAYSSNSIGPIIASPQSTGQQRRVILPSNFIAGTTMYISTNGYIGIGTDPGTAISPPSSGLFLMPLQGDQRQSALWTYSDASNFYVRWQGARYNDAAQTIDYQAKFYYGSTVVDVYFVTNNLTSNPASTTAIYNNGSEYLNWSSSTSQTSSLLNTGIMTRDTSKDGVDDDRTAVATVALTAPTITASVSPTSGTAGSTTYYASSTITGNPTPTVTYSWQYFSSSSFSWVQYTTGTQFSPPSNVNTLYPNYAWQMVATASNSQGNATSTVSITVNNPVAIPSGGTVTLTGNNTAGSVITASTSGWSGSPTSYDVYITTALSPNIPTSSSSRVSSSGGGSSTTYTITSSDAVSPVNIFRAFATASNSAGTSSTVQSSNTITTQQAATVTVPGIPTSVSCTGSGSVSWVAPTDGGTPTSYEIEFYTASNSSGSNAAGPFTSTGISSSPSQLPSPYGGANANWARVRVRARNSAGPGTYSGWYPSASTYV